MTFKMIFGILVVVLAGWAVVRIIARSVVDIRHDSDHALESGHPRLRVGTALTVGLLLNAVAAIAAVVGGTLGGGFANVVAAKITNSGTARELATLASIALGIMVPPFLLTRMANRITRICLGRWL